MQDAVKGMLGRLDDRDGGSSSAATRSTGPARRPWSSSARSWGSPRSESARSSPWAQEKIRKFAGEEKLDLPML
jgi:RNA polymerase primary sigma factor